MTLNSTFIHRCTLCLLAAAITILSACNQDKKIRGDEFIKRDVFVEVLTEMHLMDGITNDMNYYRKFNPVDSIDLYSSILEKHGVTREKYLRTIAEYSKHPELLDEVYDEVLMQLNMMQDEVEQQTEDEKKENRGGIE